MILFHSKLYIPIIIDIPIDIKLGETQKIIYLVVQCRSFCFRCIILGMVILQWHGQGLFNFLTTKHWIHARPWLLCCRTLSVSRTQINASLSIERPRKEQAGLYELVIEAGDLSDYTKFYLEYQCKWGKKFLRWCKSSSYATMLKNGARF